jgi:hypothetical protein
MAVPLDQRLAGVLPPPLGEYHEHRHADSHDGEDDVEGERHRHLGSGGEQVGHRSSEE